ncbi:hypothetical protein [Amycolatopsis saalfeldensis]|uniref:Uncharacterized protein n=1 Tax=Amycolatopsis saalfeldensis TaxID=394193 RepID=A0A1H8YMT2_9PSEU|nr:hypothetical protein [Amycolatopsis saalfeldensis]SEP53497.1 hypothetical protein SAMN04489732_12793 [Amycolatopsis saalfeldensis]
MITEERSPSDSSQAAQPHIQQNIQYLMFAAIDSTRRRALSQVDDADLTWLYRRFEPPEGFGEAQDKLERHGVVLLEGAAGSGRRAAAKMLLRLHLDAEHRFCTLPADLDGGSIDVSNVERGDLLLLDLSTVEAAEYLVLRSALAGLRADARQRDARLVVILNPQLEMWAERDETQQYRVRIGKPDPERVVQRHLAGERVPVSSALPQAAGLQTVLSKSSMTKLAWFAELTHLLFGRAGKDSDLAAALKLALTALVDRSAEVKGDLANRTDGMSRALLFTVAMLEGVHLNAVFESVRLLLSKVGHPEEEVPSLERQSFLARLHDVKAEVTDTRQVGFREIGYGEAVVSYFWDNHLDLVGAFRDWVDELVRTCWLSRPEKVALAERVAGQCLRTDNPNLLAELSGSLAAGDSEDLTPVIRNLLSAGLANLAHGRVFRRRIYDWAKDSKQPKNFAAVLVDLCSVEMARSYPEEALTRLRHLSKRLPGELDEQAVAALLRLACGDLRLFRRLLERLCPREAHYPRPADLKIFLMLVEPARLLQVDNQGHPYLSDRAVRRSVVDGWSDVLFTERGPDWPGEVGNYLTLCSSMPEAQATSALRVIVEAAGSDGVKLAEIYVVARNWASTGPDRGTRTGLALRFSQLIDKAQGVGAGPSELRYREEQR